MSERNEKVAQVLRDSAQAIRSITAERDDAIAKQAEAEAKNVAYERRVSCEKLAAQMHQKGINTDQEFSDLADSLEKSAEAGKLPVIEEAVSLTATNMSLKTASIHDAPAASGSDLERYVLGNVG
mgnify:CR=1 FL=1